MESNAGGYMVRKALSRLRLSLRVLAVGCGAAASAVAYGASSALNVEPFQSARVTFTEHIAPIVFQHCASCHRPGQFAPFSLLTYDDAKRRAQQIAAVTEQRLMPPWLPSLDTVRYLNERRLTPDQISVIQEWVRQGAPEGDRDALPKNPVLSEGWQLGEPDLVVEMPAPYTVPPGHHDIFRNFVLPVPLHSRRYVRAVELRRDNPRVLHHAVMAVDRTRLARHREQEDAEPGYDGMFPGPAVGPDGHFLGWTPGKFPFFLPEDLSWRLDRGSDIVLQLHLMPAARPEPIRVSVGLFFSERAPTRFPYLLRIGSQAIDIPAGAHEHVAADAYRLPVDVEVLGVYPHAHYLAREMRGFATLPDGRTEWLISINQWDFSWQDEYRLAKPIFLPKGSVVNMRYTYDNSAANPRNPHRPPQRVVYGPHTSDEMGDLWVQVLPRNRADFVTLQQHAGRREIEAGIAGYETIVRARPADAVSRRQLGSLYARAGKLENAVADYREALRLEPSDALAHYNLGVAMQLLQRPDAAIASFQTALRLKPGLAEAEHSWGHVLVDLGQTDKAIEHFRRATEIWPDYADAHNTWAATLLKVGRTTDAIARFRRALQIDPDHRAALNNLGTILAQRGDLVEAISLLTHAVDFYPDDRASRQNLAAAVQLRSEKEKTRRRP